MRRFARASFRLSVLTLVATLAWAPPVAAGPSPEDLRERIRDFVHLRTGVPRDAVVVPALEDFRTAREGVEVRISANERSRFDGPTPVTLSLRSGGEEIKRGVVNVDVRRGGSVLVATRPMRARTTIRAADVRTQRGESPDDAIRDAGRLVGRQTTRAVSAGAPWREHLVADPPVVARGEIVRVRIERGGLRIEALGTVRQDGAVGDRVRVLNRSSRREIVGVVGADGVVRVAF